MTFAGPAQTLPVRLGLSENWQQFSLLVVVNAFVGMMIGAERAVLPLFAQSDFGVHSASAMFTFLVAFGLTKALANFAAGALSGRFGRRRILIAGWTAALPVPILLWWAPSWAWIVAANILLGVNQGLAWSATVIMKIDLAGPRRRGLAMGLNEFAGYVAVAGAALGAGFLASSLGGRMATVWIATGASIAGLTLTLFLVRDTTSHVRLEHSQAQASRLRGFWSRTWSERPLLAANQAGFANNLNDGVAWGIFPLLFAAAGLPLREIGFLAALYPASWGITQIFTGALSDRIGRRALIVHGMFTQAVALALIAWTTSAAMWAAAAVLLGLGTAAVYPTLIAHVSDSLTPHDRASGVGVYRLWRDLGYVAGALLTGLVADLSGYRAAIALAAVLTAASGLWGASLLRAAAGANRKPSG